MRGRSLVLIGAAEVELDNGAITARIEDRGVRQTARLTPMLAGGRVGFEMRCSCAVSACVHLAAAALAALDRYPALRRPAVTQPVVTRPVVVRRGSGRPKRAGAITLPPTASERLREGPAIVPVLRLRRLRGPDEFGQLRLLDALSLDFDYAGTLVSADDERRRVRGADGIEHPRDPAAEAAAFEALQADGFVQLRIAEAGATKGRRAFVFRGESAAPSWHRFLAERLPALHARGWRSVVEPGFGPRVVERVGGLDLVVRDAASLGGRFALDFGIEIDGVRHKLLPILAHLQARGGIAAARIVGEELITSLPDGRVLRLPAERIGRLLAVMGDLLEAAGDVASDDLVLPAAEAPSLLDLESLLSTRWQDAAAIEALVGRFRADPEILPVLLPASFTASLRPYQQQGVAWLQHLRGHGLGGFLADDMGLGKTAQSIAHITVEHAAGRLTQPALVVVPTSLIANWRAELVKFAPHLRVLVLHGLPRAERQAARAEADVVLTTYALLVRDAEAMRARPWHLIVLDEAQAIKNPEAKATRAACQLDAAQRLCLSGTPIENNLDELWSHFAFLMPGLLGERTRFARRFRTPIEKHGDETRRLQLIRRIQPFVLRRTKAEVASELPPKHVILRRITLAPAQRELYETVRATLFDTLRERIAERSLAQSRIVVLDALLKLRQLCCDPRLLKLASAYPAAPSSKLETLLEMLTEMLAEGRRILLFSQFTSMLDLIKPRLDAAGIAFVELRGDTRDRAEPVRAFQAGEVPLFLISLKAGGRGLNLTAADTVIHYDPWWNPAVEEQASDRAHRIGQNRSVFIYKLIAADTVEERILDLQRRKADLASLAFAGPQAALDTADLAYLFAAEPDRAAA